MVVVITSTGGVSKRLFTFDSRRSTPGLADWAAAYLNERLVGLGARRADAPRAGSPTPSSAPPSSAFLDAARARLHRARGDGRADALRRRRRAAASRGPLPRRRQLNAVMELLERRVTLLGVLRDALAARDTYVRSARRTRRPRCAASRSWRQPYGLASALARHRLGDRAGADGLRGSRSAPCAPRPVELSRFVEDVYEVG